MTSKQEFFALPRYQGLTRQEKEQRWRQHVASRQVRNQQFTVRPPSEIHPEAALMHTFPKCAIHYLEALEAPFELTSPACIPDLHAVASKKIKVHMKYNFSTGLDGSGFFLACNQCKSNTNLAALSTTPTYPGGNSTLVPTTPAAPNYNQHFLSKLPYTTTDFESETFQPGLQGRVVGTAVRIRYIGALLARSGQIIALRHPDNGRLQNRLIEDLKSYETAVIYPVDEEWTYVNYKPVKPQEYEYSQYAQTAGSPPDPNVASNPFEMGFIVVGTTQATGQPGPAPFEVEIVKFIEYIGNIDNVTHTHSDVNAMSQIRNKLPPSSASRNPLQQLSTTADRIGRSIIKHSAPMITQSIKDSASNKLVNYVKGNLGKLTNFGREGFVQSLMQRGSGILKDVLPEMEGYLETGLMRSLAFA